MSKLLSDLIHKGVRPVVEGPTCDGKLSIKPDFPEPFFSSESDDESEEDYAQEYIDKELQLYAEYHEDNKVEPPGMALSIDDCGDLAGSDIRSEVYRMAEVSEVFRKYNFDQTITRKELTIHASKDKILNVIRTNSVVIIDGPTGCGKTTQVPQYILDDCRLNHKECNIVVTQPRKIATITVAKRVCQERGWSIGSVVGYQVGLEKQVGPEVILTYMTTGVLLQKLIHAKSLSQYTHIIIDEIHERNQDLDFLLLVVRKLLFTKSFQTKVVLMSATIDAEEFAYYFRSQYKAQDTMAPVVHIRDPSRYTVGKFYLDNLPQSTPAPVFDVYKPEISLGVINAFLFLMNVLDKIDKNDSEDQVQLGSVLVFLPGIREIEDVEKLLKDKQNQLGASSDSSNKIWEIIPLHSSLPNDEQAKVFKTVDPPLRKVILSTNLAESSITVQDIRYVVDFCLTKNMVVDKVSKFSSLQLEWASHVSCDQRAGRAGRVANGRVYRLVPKKFYETQMEKKGQPEIMRAPLETVVLLTKLLEFNEEPKAILALAINPPNLNNIENTVWHLKEIGAMLKTCRGRTNLSDGDITFLGKVMAGLPMDVYLSKLIVLGHMFSVLYEAIIMATGCAVPNIFSTPYHERLQAYNKKLLWADGSCSDMVAMLNLYKVWQSCKREGAFRRTHAELAWCKANLVSLKGLREWHLLITETQARLKRLGIEETSGPLRVNLSMKERATVLKIIICGAFYPNYFIRSASHGQIDEKFAVKTVGGRDPYKTVYLSGMEPGQPGSLYNKELRKILHLPEDSIIEFDDTSKVYIEFKNFKEPETVTVDGQQCVTTIPGKIAMPVYHAVKKRMLGTPIKLNILPKELAWDHLNLLEKKEAEKAKQGSSNQSIDEKDAMDVNCFSLVQYDPLPSLDTEYITIVISNRIDAGHFFCQNVYDSTQQILESINIAINSTPLTSVDVKDFVPEKLYACKYSVDGQYYRAKVQFKLSDSDAQVLFVDYGNIENIPLLQLRELPDVPVLKYAPLAFECVLSEVEPAYDLYRRGLWTESVNKLFDSKTQNTLLYGKVYSVCDDVVHLEIFKSEPKKGQSMSINQWLINEGHARKVEESFISKKDHETRLFVLSSNNPHGEAKKLGNEKKKRKEHTKEMETNLQGVEKFIKEMDLKGPFSPLEMKVFSAIAHGFNKSASIEPTSVNAVLLDSDPLDPHTKLLVAAAVHQSSSGDRLLLRQTTIMPNIPGFPFLMALLFCPEMEPKLTDDGLRISSILCGLGSFEDSKRACYPSHDMVMTLDVEINEAVINKVNELRYSMNMCLNTMDTILQTNGTIEQIEPFQRHIKLKIFQLLRLKMESISPFHNKYAEVWKNYPLDMEILRCPKVDPQFVWQLHWFFKVRSHDEEPSQLQRNLLHLTSMAKRLIPFETVECEVCKVELLTIGELRNHLISASHKQNENTNISQALV